MYFVSLHANDRKRKMSLWVLCVRLSLSLLSLSIGFWQYQFNMLYFLCSNKKNLSFFSVICLAQWVFSVHQSLWLIKIWCHRFYRLKNNENILCINQNISFLMVQRTFRILLYVKSYLSVYLLKSYLGNIWETKKIYLDYT